MLSGSKCERAVRRCGAGRCGERSRQRRDALRRGRRRRLRVPAPSARLAAAHRQRCPATSNRYRGPGADVTHRARQVAADGSGARLRRAHRAEGRCLRLAGRDRGTRASIRP
ncbi:hypothetical protein EVAR_70110_1 [Eumeta japonica]|uniref:Uncharacterized protein n=1 Tax=Eumeta variegata TaxID=151549 RepID=A0A4C2A3Y5_EUMVA|nr:hypothetical protein EVAR_70110_1 [Eumeta japonica]